MKKTIVVGALALAFAAPASGVSLSVYQLPRATHATGVRTVCYSQQAWRKFVADSHSDVAANGLYDWHNNTINLFSGDGCRPVQHWRTASSENLGFAIFLIGHEAAHARQYAEGKPFDEHKADCAGYWGFNKLRVKMGIGRKVRNPWTKLDLGC